MVNKNSNTENKKFNLEERLKNKTSYNNKFDPDLINKLIDDYPVEIDKEAQFVAYQGNAVRCDVDLYKSSKLVKILKNDYNLPESFFTNIIKTQTKDIVNQYKGFWLSAKGDSAEFVFGGDNALEKGIRCSIEMTYWFDRVLSEHVKDYVAAHEVLREQGKLKGEYEPDEKAREKMMAEIQKIKNKWGDEVPKSHKKIKELYEAAYSEIDQKIEDIGRLTTESTEFSGRLKTKVGISYGELNLSVTKSISSSGRERIQLDPQGSATYLISRMTDKAGPLGGQKDVILLGAYEEIPKDELPNLIDIRLRETSRVGSDEFFVYDILGVKNYEHPTFDGRILKESAIAENLPSYRIEINKAVSLLQEMYKKKQRGSARWLDVTGGIEQNKMEAIDRYKKDRTLMLTAVTLGIIDDFIDKYDQDIKNENKRNETKSDKIRTKLVQEWKSDEGRENMILSALTYTLGGSLVRRTSDTPQYPTRMLNPQENLSRLNSEMLIAQGVTVSYSDLKNKGIPEILSYQDKELSNINDPHVGMKTYTLKLATRLIHNMSHRAWKEPCNTIEEAIYKMRDEFSGVFDKEGQHCDGYFGMIENSLISSLGLKKEAVENGKKYEAPIKKKIFLLPEYLK